VFVCVFASGAKMSKLDMYAAHSELQDTLQRIFIILRGLPGAGKSRVARTLRDIEVK
jgi:adenylylsulfate kinase-like enzyme